ncbi:hypothetical protein FHS96_003002 [Sphingomonas zeicaulis]|uniref:hypothetical protein n=1 Tax=Sphingomonas zeicaulis TaxID=1632740 RepID=UPI003D217B4A
MDDPVLEETVPLSTARAANVKKAQTALGIINAGPPACLRLPFPDRPFALTEQSGDVTHLETAGG